MQIDLGQAIEIVANIGALAGIVFLAFQLRQNTVAVRSEASQGLQNQWSSQNEMLLDESMADLFRRGMLNPSDLDDTEIRRFEVWWVNSLYGWENAYYLVRDGVHDAARAEGLWRLVRSHLEAPGLQEFWKGPGKNMVSAEFGKSVDSEVAQRKDVLRIWNRN